MPENLQIFFDLLVQFTGDGGGHRPGIVPYGLAGLFWLGLLLISQFKYRRETEQYLWLLQWGFAAGLARQVFMLTVKLLEAYSVVSIEQLHVFFPPLEHALSDAAEMLIAAGYMLFLTKQRKKSIRFAQGGVAAVALCYLITFYWWAQYISANPDSKFGQTWCDWVFRINASLWLAVAVVFLWRHANGWCRNLVCLALSFFFLDDFLKLPDMMLDEQYESVFAPIRHGLALAAVPIFAYVYIRIQASGIRTTFEDLEGIIEERTAELIIASKEIEDALDRQIQFTADASHELRTPLTIIFNETEWVQEQSRSLAEYQNSVQTCRKAALHMGELVDVLLDLARGDSGEMHLMKKQVEINTLCENAMSLMRPIAHVKKVELKLFTCLDVVYLEVDRLRIRQVLINLLKNAINHSAEGGVISLRIVSSTVYCEISIEDSGVGISSKEISSIFNRFYQGDSTRNREGVGLGLAVSQSIVNAHGGDIRVASELGKGSVFTIDLPK